MSNVPRTIVDPLPPIYASHFLLTINEDCLLIESSSGIVAGDAGDGTTLPVNCRLAVPWNAAQRLAAVLNSAIAQRAARGSGGDQAVAAPAPPFAAQLPPLGV
jgi:hypothetical protein